MQVLSRMCGKRFVACRKVDATADLRSHNKRLVRDQSVEDALLLLGLDNETVEAVVVLADFLAD